MHDTDCLYYLSQLVGSLACSRYEVDAESADEERRLSIVRDLEARVTKWQDPKDFTPDVTIDGLSTRDSDQSDLRTSIYSNALFNFCIDQIVRDRARWRGEDVAANTYSSAATTMCTHNGTNRSPKSAGTMSEMNIAVKEGASQRTPMDGLEKKLRRDQAQLTRELKAKSMICHDLRIQLNQVHQIFDQLLICLEDDNDIVPGLLVAIIKGEVLYTSAIKKDLKRAPPPPPPPPPPVAIPTPPGHLAPPSSGRIGVQRQHSELITRRRFRVLPPPPPPAVTPPPREYSPQSFFQDKDLFKTPQSPQGNQSDSESTAENVNEKEAFMRGYLGLGRTELEDDVEEDLYGRRGSLDPWPAPPERPASFLHHHRAESSALQNHYRPLSVDSVGGDTGRSKKGSTKILHAISKFLNGGTIRKNQSFIV